MCGCSRDYRWPGNVREMAAVMDRAVLIGQGQSLSVAAALGRDRALRRRTLQADPIRVVVTERPSAPTTSNRSTS